MGPLGWANALRGARGLAALEEDALLSETAARWARALAQAGMLSHRGEDGSTALDRYRRLGGTEARIGEILGAGPSLLTIERAWESSPAHKQMVLKPSWTHAGWASAPAGDGRVWVMLFCQELVQGLRIGEDPDGLEVSGTFLPADARQPVLLAGLLRVEPASWDPVTRAFRFLLQPAQSAGYLRLGYIGAAGTVVVTNAVTWPRGTGSPGGPARFEGPAARP